MGYRGQVLYLEIKSTYYKGAKKCFNFIWYNKKKFFW